VFIAVGTPSRRGDGHADLSYVYAAAREIAAAIDGFTWSSPSRPCRSAPATRSSASSARPGPMPSFAVVSNPEFLREGAAIEDFKRPDRVVIGADDERAREVMASSTARCRSTQAPIVFTDRRTAELIKYAANAFLATKITFINEIADLCEKVGADVQDVARGIGLDNRIGRSSCMPGRAMAARASPRTRWR
jgi:UDPglucose 6-dehydrogenase